MLSTRFEMRIPYRLYESAKLRAAEKRVSLAEYIKRLLRADLQGSEEKSDG